MGLFDNSNSTDQSDPGSFDYQSAAANLALRQQLASQMMNTPPPQMQVTPGGSVRGAGGGSVPAGGWVVPPNKWAGAESLAQKLAGIYLAKSNQGAQTQLNQNTTAAINAALNPQPSAPPQPAPSGPPPDAAPPGASGPPAGPTPVGSSGSAPSGPAPSPVLAMGGGAPQQSSPSSLNTILRLAQLGPVGQQLAQMQIQKMSPNWDIEKTDDGRIIAVNKNNPTQSVDATPSGSPGNINVKGLDSARPGLEAMRYINADGSINQTNVDQANVVRAKYGAPSLTAPDLHAMYGSGWAAKDEALVTAQADAKAKSIAAADAPAAAADRHASAVAAQTSAAAAATEAGQKVAATNQGIQSQIDAVQNNIGNIQKMQDLVQSGNLRVGPHVGSVTGAISPTPAEQEFDDRQRKLATGILSVTFPDSSKVSPAMLAAAKGTVPNRNMDPSTISGGLSDELQRQQQRLAELKGQLGGSGAPAPAPAAAPVTTATGPNGQKLFLRNGQWSQQ